MTGRVFFVIAVIVACVGCSDESSHKQPIPLPTTSGDTTATGAVTKPDSSVQSESPSPAVIDNKKSPGNSPTGLPFDKLAEAQVLKTSAGTIYIPTGKDWSVKRQADVIEINHKTADVKIVIQYAAVQKQGSMATFLAQYLRTSEKETPLFKLVKTSWDTLDAIPIASIESTYKLGTTYAAFDCLVFSSTGTVLVMARALEADNATLKRLVRYLVSTYQQSTRQPS